MDNMITASAVLIPLAVLLLLFIIPIAFWFYGSLKKGSSAYADCIALEPESDPVSAKEKTLPPPPPPSLEKSSSAKGGSGYTTGGRSSVEATPKKVDPVEDSSMLVMYGHQLLINSQESAPSYAYDAVNDLLYEELSSSKSPTSYEPPASSHSSWRDDTLHSSHTPSWHSSSSHSSYSDHSSSDHGSSSYSSYDSGSSYSSSDSSSSSSWD